MLDISVCKDVKKIEENLNKIDERFKTGIVIGAKMAGRSVQKRVTTMLATGQRTGRMYKGMPHRSSAEGEMPRSQSGRLLRSVFYEASSSHQFRVGATESYAERLAKIRKIKGEDWFKHVIGLEESITEQYLHNCVYKEITK